MKLLREYGKYFYKENPKTNQIEKYQSQKENKPVLTVELENRLDPDVALDIPFQMGKIAYDAMFVRELRFASFDEVNTMMSILDKIKEYENTNKPCVILSSLNCYLIVASAGKEDVFDLKNKKFADYVYEAIAWMHEQDRYIT